MTAPTDTDRKLDTIRKLLAKAEGAATTEEAEAYTAKATEMMMRYSINEALIDTGRRRDTADTIGTRQFTLAPYGLAKATLLSGISHVFGCKAVRTQSGRENVVKVFGFESDLLIVDTLFASLLIQAEREMARAYADKPTWENGRSFKTSFMGGYANTVFQRLAEQRRDVVRKVEDDTPGTALALRDRSLAVNGAVAEAHPRLTAGSGVTVTSRSGLDSGRDAGRRADLGQTRINGGARRALGR